MIYDDKAYNCLHYAVERYQQLTGVDVGLYVSELMTGKAERRINPAKLANFRQIDTPVSPCFVVMKAGVVHGGIYHDGLIHHLTPSGEQAVPLHIIKLNYPKVQFYAFCPPNSHQRCL